MPGGRQPGLWAGSPPPTLPAGPPPPKTVPGPPRAPPWPGPPARGARVGVLPNRMQERGTRQPGAMSCPRQGDGYPWSARQASETCAPGTILPKSYAAPPQPLPGARGSRGERCLCRSAPLTLPSRLRSPRTRTGHRHSERSGAQSSASKTGNTLKLAMSPRSRLLGGKNLISGI